MLSHPDVDDEEHYSLLFFSILDVITEVSGTPRETVDTTSTLTVLCSLTAQILAAADDGKMQASFAILLEESVGFTAPTLKRFS